MKYRHKNTAERPGTYLFRQLQIVSPLAIIVILIVAMFGLKTVFHKMLIFEAEKDAIRVSRAIRDSELNTLLLLKTDEKGILYISKEDMPKIDRHLRSFLAPFDIVKIKIFNSETLIIYSTDVKIMNKYDSENHCLKKVFKGSIVSKYATKDHSVDLEEEEYFNVDVIETYIPIYDDDKKIIGVFEIYKDVTEDLLLARTDLIRACIVLSITVLGVFAALMRVIKYAGNVINKGTDELVDTNKKLSCEVTKRKHAELEVNKSNEQLREQDRIRNEFVITVSHELRTPLTIFKNTLTNMLDGVMGKLQPKQRQSLEMANKEVDRLANIISDFLDIVKIEGDKMEMMIEPVSVRTIVTDVIDMYRHLAKSKDIEMLTLMPDSELFVMADHDKIVQVAGNLIDNAIKFLPDCGGCITIQVSELDNNEVVIAVEDNGIGIEADDIDKIFDRFTQIKKHIGPGAHGTGLGLAICKDLIKLHDGRIWAENLPEGGASFGFSLPKANPDAELLISGTDTTESNFM